MVVSRETTILTGPIANATSRPTTDAHPPDQLPTHQADRLEAHRDAVDIPVGQATPREIHPQLDSPNAGGLAVLLHRIGVIETWETGGRTAVQEAGNDTIQETPDRSAGGALRPDESLLFLLGRHGQRREVDQPTRTRTFPTDDGNQVLHGSGHDGLLRPVRAVRLLRCAGDLSRPRRDPTRDQRLHRLATTRLPLTEAVPEKLRLTRISGEDPTRAHPHPLHFSIENLWMARILCEDIMAMRITWVVVVATEDTPLVAVRFEARR